MSLWIKTDTQASKPKLWNKTDTQASKPKYLNVGQVVTVRVTNGGSLYGSEDTVAFTVAPDGGVTATGTLVVVGGTITGVTITNPGAGYLVAPTATITTATGSSAILTAVIAPVVEDNSKIVFVDVAEAQKTTNRAKGIKTPGWTKVSSKTVDGQVRNSAEVLVAMSVASATSGDAGDAADDLVVADANFTVTTQPVAQTVVAPAGVSFVVVVDPSAGASYQWQVQTAGAGAYANVTDGGVYSGATTATLTISNSTGLNKNRYRVIALNATGTASVTSKGAQLTVTA